MRGQRPGNSGFAVSLAAPFPKRVMLKLRALHEARSTQIGLGARLISTKLAPLVRLGSAKHPPLVRLISAKLPPPRAPR